MYVVAYLYSLIPICGCGDWLIQKLVVGILDHMYLCMLLSERQYMTVLNMFKLFVLFSPWIQKNMYFYTFLI